MPKKTIGHPSESYQRFLAKQRSELAQQLWEERKERRRRKKEGPKEEDQYFKARAPDESCFLCGRTQEEVGGYRLRSAGRLSVGLSTRYLGGGNPDYPYVSIPFLDRDQGKKPGSDILLYVTFCGSKGTWTQERMEKARRLLLADRQPWFCQNCAGPRCELCKSYLNYPVGCEILYDSGCSGYAPIFMGGRGCSNPECENHRKWEGGTDGGNQ